MVYALDVAAPSAIEDALYFISKHPVVTIIALLVLLLLLKVYIDRIWAIKKKRSEEKSSPPAEETNEA